MARPKARVIAKREMKQSMETYSARSHESFSGKEIAESMPQWLKYDNEIQRLASYAGCPYKERMWTTVLAHSGFLWVPQQQIIMCFFCNVIVSEWRDDYKVDDIHSFHNQDCPMIRKKSQLSTLTFDADRKSTLGSEKNEEEKIPSDDNSSPPCDENHNEAIDEDSSGSPGNNDDIHEDGIETLRYNDSVNEILATPAPFSASPLVLSNSGTVSHPAIPQFQHQPLLQAVPSPGMSPSLPPPSHSPPATVPIPSSVPSSLPSPPESTTARPQQTPASVQGHPTPPIARPVSSPSTEHPTATAAMTAVANPNKSYTHEDLNIMTTRPKRPEYAVQQKREETFPDWPQNHYLHPKELVSAGMYYAGYSDCVRCFFCGGGLRNWDPQDDVWVEHARWFPKCVYVRLHKGNDFMTAVQNLHNECKQRMGDQTITLAQVEAKIVTMRNEVSAFRAENFEEMELLQNPAVMAVIDSGYSKRSVINVALELGCEEEAVTAWTLFDKLTEKGIFRSDNSSADSLEDSIPDIEERLEAVQVENNQVRQRTTCKVCLEQEVGVIFLPCAHLVCCVGCSFALTTCPMCRREVKGTVRAHIS